MGDKEPPGELDAAPEAGMHLGFPYYAGGMRGIRTGRTSSRRRALPTRPTPVPPVMDPNGEGNAAAVIPALRGQHAEYRVIALRAYGTGERRDPTGIMREIGKTLSEDEMRALAAYAENLSGEASGAGGSRPATSP